MSDAWDDDWIAKNDSAPTPDPAPAPVKMSQRERRAQQAEFNKRMWEEAENTQDDYFLTSRDIVPLKEDFKPIMKLLSRKPAAKPADPASGIGGIGTEDDDDSDDEARKKPMTPQERREKAQREREEKQKKYDERKQELFGTKQTLNASLQSAATPKKNGSPRNQSRNQATRESRPSSSASNRTKQLYDPNDTKAGATSVLKKEISATANEIKPIRTPRNPDGSGRGGFGFASRSSQGV